MRARLYRKGPYDAAELDRLLECNRAGDVRLDTDRIVVVGHGNSHSLSGVLVWRPAGFVHELVLEPHATRRLAAGALVNYALGDVRGLVSSRLSQAVFLIDKTNAPMLRFVREMGAVEQSENSVVFTLDL